MSSPAFIDGLKLALPKESWPWVAAALRQDPVIWDSLQTELGQRILAQKPTRPEAFAPVELALQALDCTIPSGNLRATPIQAIDAGLRQRAVLAARALSAAEDELGLEGDSSAHLARAGLLALYFRERRRVVDSWQGLSDEVARISPTVLGILFGMAPDPLELLRMILLGGAVEKDVERAVQPVLHAVLSNPLPPQKQAELLKNLSTGLAPAQQLALLRQLGAQRPGLAAQLARELTPAGQTPSSGKDLSAAPGDPERLLADLGLFIHAAERRRLAGQPAEDAQQLIEAAQTARRIQAQIQARLAEAYAKTGGAQAALAAWKQANEFEPESPDHLAGLAQALIDAGRTADAQAVLAQPRKEPASVRLLIASARLSNLRGDSGRARQDAAQALKLILDETRAAKDGKSKARAGRRAAASGQAADLTHLLLELGLPGEAAQAARLALAAQPANPELLAQLSRACRMTRATAQAVEAAQTAVLLAPGRVELRRQLADCLEAAGEWQPAYQERAAILDPSANAGQARPDPADLHALANSAIRAGCPEQALEACQKALQLDANDGLAYAFTGEASAAMGDLPAGLENLRRATQLTPQHARPWLALAHLYQELEQPQKSLETLQLATRAAPDLAELHLALGEAYLAGDTPTQALDAFRKAASLSRSQRADSDGTALLIALRLGQTLHRLGHLEEAQQVLEQAHRSAQNHAGIAHGYAQTLLALGQQEAALSPLMIVLESNPGDPAPYLDYARCLLSLAGPQPEGLAEAERQPVNTRSGPDQQEPVSVETAVPYLQKALEIAPNLAEAQALLAEALASGGQLLPSMEAYRQALETELAQDPQWQTRLSLGLGEVALKLGQIETAIASLQDANQCDPLNPKTQQLLSEAYDAAGLTENAFQAARAALLLAPDDVERLTWFAEQALDLRTRPNGAIPQALTEAISALNRAITLSPQRTDLLIRLGQVQMQAGDIHAARSTFSKLASIDVKAAGPARVIPDLYLAAKNLQDLGDAPGAVACLEHALQSNRRRSDWPSANGSDEEPSLLDLLTELAAARYHSGRPQAALEALEQAITLAPDKAALYLDKADLHLEMGQPQLDPADGDSDPASVEHIQAALECLEVALKLEPSDPSLHQRAALIQRTIGNLPAALDHSLHALEFKHGSTAGASKNGMPVLQSDLAARALAGDLARAQLKDGLAREILDNPDQLSGSPFTADRLDYRCLRAEYALEAGDYLSASEELSTLLDFASEHPRVLAIQARLVAQRGDTEVADQILRDAAETVFQMRDLTRLGKKTPKGSARQDSLDAEKRGIGLLRVRVHMLNNLLAVAEAAIELHRWDTVLQLLKQAASSAPLEPLSHLQLARALVLRAEFQSLCQDLDVVGHAPGEAALDLEAYQDFVTAIQAAEKLTGDWQKASSGDWQKSKEERTHSLLAIARWRARGQAVFQPGPEPAEALAALPLNPEDVAARVGCLRKIGDLAGAGLAARSCPQHPRVLIHLSLALAEEKPRQALAAAHAAVEALVRPESSRGEGAGRLQKAGLRPVFSSRKEDAPLVHSLLARLVHKRGNRANDSTTALQAIQTALAIWPDEPRWHALAAEIYLGGGGLPEGLDPSPAYSHLEEAIKLEPRHAGHYLALGKAYLKGGRVQQAIPVLEQSARLTPEQPEPWLLLARAFHATGDLEQAAARAERAVTLAPDELEPLLLRGEIALDADNPRGAQSRAQAALRLNPQDPAATLLLARALNGLDRPGEALEAVEKALPLALEPLPFLLERARLLLRSQGQETALGALQELAERYPSEPSVLSLLAECLAGAGQREAAIHSAQRALRCEHDLTAGHFSLEHANMHLLLGRLLRHAGQLDQAVHHLSEAIHHAPHLLEPYLELGHTHQERRQFTQALNAYQQATAVAPTDPRGFYHAGLMFKEGKNYVSAETMLRKAANLAPNDLSIHRLLAAVVALNLVHNRRDAGRESQANQ